MYFVTDPNKHSLLCVGGPRVRDSARGVRRAARLGGATRQGQVLELRVLQVHLRVWRHQRAVHGRGASLVLLVHPRWIPTSIRAVVQRSF